MPVLTVVKCVVKCVFFYSNLQMFEVCDCCTYGKAIDRDNDKAIVLPLQDFPTDIIKLILFKLNSYSLLQLAKVNKPLRNLVMDMLGSIKNANSAIDRVLHKPANCSGLFPPDNIDMGPHRAVDGRDDTRWSGIMEIIM